MKYQLLVNTPHGEQAIILIGETGGYFDQDRILWDERTDGELPPLTLGKMQRTGGILVTLEDYLPEHASWLAEKQQKDIEQSNYEALRQEMLNDPEVAQIRALAKAGDIAGINSYFGAKNLAQIAESVTKLAKIIATMNEGK